MNPTEFAVLEFPFHKGDHPIQEVGKKILIASGCLTYVVDKLEQEQYVRRKSCVNERRVTYVGLTSLVEELMNQVFPKHEDMLTKFFKQLDMLEVDETIHLMK
ncbi:MarR family winged helix-turn-helix transcriptional regulator [Peribacillus frigoritolerans]|uniref:MarR family winged helix-turn-helix transcriptional regulator n=1 Tax=Peribacillus frigoritolerans TaxID=450367 RepID=UPI0039A0D5EE